MKKPIVLAIVFIIIIVVVYVTCFYDAPLSDKTSDWGAFGNYVGIGIRLLPHTITLYNCITIDYTLLIYHSVT